MNHTDPTAETARGLLYRHGLPEDVIDGALCLHAQELAAVQRAFAEQEDGLLSTTSAAVYVQGVRDAADRIDPTKPAASAVVSPPTDRADLRDRIAEALARVDGHGQHSVLGSVIERYRHRADAVLAVLPAVADRAATLAEAIRRVEDPKERAKTTTGLGLGWEAARDVLRRLAVEAHGTGTQQPEPESGCGHCSGVGWPRIKGNCPACRRASLFLGTGGYPTCSNWECPEPDAATTVLEQYANEAHPPLHVWRVETFDGEWVRGSVFANRQAAVERYETANSTAPVWKDGTPVERRIVRETTTYTVDEPAPVAQQPAALRAELKPWQLLGDAPTEPLPQTERVIGGRRLGHAEQQAAAADGEEAPEVTLQCDYADWHDGHPWSDRPNTWCPGHDGP